MYNRYIPQPDGSYQRKRIEEPRQEPPRPGPQPPQESITPPIPPNPAPSCPPPPQPGPACRSDGGFLRQLLPGDFDTGDLIVIVLLLLIAGDCEQERSNALLTLALYLIM